MKLNITFVDEKLQPISQEEHELDFVPQVNQVLKLVVDSQQVQYRVLTLGGGEQDGKFTPSIATLQKV
jgi:hypothetical protein